jgi:hypothetical protein
MLKPITLLVILFLSLTGTLCAQATRPAVIVWAADAPEERGSTRLVFWDRMNNPLGQVVFNYGRPAWLAPYEDAAKFDAFTKDHVWRLGSNYWTTLDTSIPITIADREIPVGLWYVGLHRSADGATWTLAFLNPEKVRTAKGDAIQIENAPIEFKVPISVGQVSDSADKLTIVLSSERQNPTNGALKIRWGKWQMTAPVVVKIQNN